MFNACETIPLHPIARVYGAMAQDPNPDKIDLGIGVYRNAQGDSPIMECVRRAQQQLWERQRTKDYLTPDGNKHYCSAMEELLLGASHAALTDKRIRSIQTPGGGGALRVGAELIKSVAPAAKVWVSTPTWDHQVFVFASAGLAVREYPYYDKAGNGLQFDAMLMALRDASAGDVVLLHGCCHNPTGQDLQLDQWRALAALCSERGLVPFIDIAYQGFGDGVEEDVAGTRLLVDKVPETIIAGSSSKSFGIYRDRAGIISVVFSAAGQVADNGGRLLSEVGRSLYFMPPDDGAAVVAHILRDESLQTLWRDELNVMRVRVKQLRQRFADSLQAAVPSANFHYIEAQKGMFSLLPLTPQQLLVLERRHSIYMMPDARINFAALTEDSLQRVATAIARVIRDA